MVLVALTVLNDLGVMYGYKKVAANPVWMALPSDIKAMYWTTIASFMFVTYLSLQALLIAYYRRLDVVITPPNRGEPEVVQAEATIKTNNS